MLLLLSSSVLFATYKLAFGHKMPSFWPEAVDAKQNQRITPNKPKGQTLCYQCTKSYAKILSILTIGQVACSGPYFRFFAVVAAVVVVVVIVVGQKQKLRK